MKQTWASAVIVGLFACTAVLGAQTSSKPASSRTTSRAQQPQQETITVSGCVQDNNQASANAAAPTTSTRATRAKTTPLPSFSLSNASASTGEPAAAGAGNGSYILQGMDLSREIGQQVEVTATVMPERPSRARVRGTSGSTAATPDENAGAKHLWVSSVKMISPTCSGQ